MAKAEKQSRTSLWESITARVIDELESGTVPWKRSWTGPNGMPRNGVSGKAYRGCNVLLTILTAMSRGYDDPRWYSFKQANLIAEKAARAAGRDTIQDDRGVWCFEDTKQAHPKKSKQKGFRYESCGGVKKGQNKDNDSGGTQVVWWSKINIKAKQDDDAEPDEETDGKIGRSAWIIKPFTVFNAEQLDDHVREYLGTVTGIEGLEHETDATAEAVLAGYDHNVKFGGNQPCYSPTADEISMPQLKYFDSVDQYYSAYFHEAGHSTGHPDKLNRKGITEFNGSRNHVYADEELVAELTACLLCGFTGVARDETVKNSGAYLRSWIKKLQDDPKIIVYAAQRAQKAADFILGEEPKYEEKVATATASKLVGPLAPLAKLSSDSLRFLVQVIEAANGNGYDFAVDSDIEGVQHNKTQLKRGFYCLTRPSRRALQAKLDVLWNADVLSYEEEGTDCWSGDQIVFDDWLKDQLYDDGDKVIAAITHEWTTSAKVLEKVA